MRSLIVIAGLVLAFGLAPAADNAVGLLSSQPTAGGVPLLTEVGWTDNPAETLHYDGDNASAIGLTGGGTFRGAVRFTPTRTCTIKSVLFYQNDPSSNDYAFIYAEGTDTTPGVTLDSVSYSGSAGTVWKRADFAAPLIVIAGVDFWACVQMTHDSGAFPLGTDAGPMLRNRGGFISMGAGWSQLADLQLDYNWNIRAIIEPVPGFDHDVGVSRILIPGTSVGEGAYTPTARITNFGENAESSIPVTCRIDSLGTLVYDQTTAYAGPLQPGHRAEVAFTPDWTTGAGGNAYTVEMFTALAGDLDTSNDTTTQTTSIATYFLMMDHDTGYCKLTVTCIGAIGYDEPADAGNGFRYPKTAASQLFHGSFAVGNSPAYVADRHFGQPASGGVNTDLVPVESLRPIDPPTIGDEHFYAVFDDAGHAAPKEIEVTQNSYMSAAPGYDDFVILVYDIENAGAGAVDGLYAAVFGDFDVGADPRANTVTSDETRRLSYMRWVGSANPTVGLKILEPRSFANLAAIDHDVYVYPDSCMTDRHKFIFMDGTVAQRNSTRPYDWSICTSVGPFDLPAGATYRFAVAFIGGTTVNEVEAHADSAQSWYGIHVGLAERPGEVKADDVRCEVLPNPFRGGTFIHYFSRAAGMFELEVFDATGRMVEARSLEIEAGGGTYHWQPAALARGVYFLNVKTPDNESVVKVLRLN